MKRAIIAAALLLGLGHAARANYHDILTDQLNFEWAPAETQQTLDSDIRLRGMGFLNLPIEDESNLIGAYKLGGFAAGIPLDYGRGKIELGSYFDWATIDDNSRQVDNFTGEKAESDTTGASLMGYAPFRAFGTGGLIFSKQWSWNEFRFNDNATAFNPNLADSSIRDFNLGYGHHFPCGFTGGLNISHKLDRVEDEVGNSKDDLRTYTREFSPSFGYVWRLRNEQRLTWVGGPRFIRMEDENSLGNVEDDIDGVKWGTGLIYQRGGAMRIGGFVESGTLDGERRLNGANVGEQELDRMKFLLRGYYRTPGAPYSFGALYQTTDRTLTDKNLAGVTTSERETDRTTFGVGSAYHFREKGLVGLEYRFLDADITNNVFPATPALNREEKGNQLSLGGEYYLSDPLTLRAGLLHQKITSDPVGTPPEADLNTWQLSAGVTYKIRDWEISGATWYTTQEQDEVASLQDDQELKSTGLQLLGVYRWGPEMVPPPAP